MMRVKWVNIGLIAILASLQFRLWFGKHSIPDFHELESQVAKQVQQNANLAQRNALLKADIEDLTLGMDAIEERARSELGLIKRNETFYRILPNE